MTGGVKNCGCGKKLKVIYPRDTLIVEAEPVTSLTTRSISRVDEYCIELIHEGSFGNFLFFTILFLQHRFG
jgi:hypothetical protein